MTDASDEDLFLAFQAERDHDALATLFRRRADELLKLAVFLAPRPTEAEDLLQATFLSAISRAETYRPGNRVMSWLCGILTNHARMLRRSERRRPPETPSDQDPSNPVDAALQSELDQALRDGISGLKEPYKSVLQYHLHRGLNSQEIGREMKQKPATVRKQLARALEKLRAALPLGLATGLALRMSPAQIAQRAAEAAPFIGGDGVPVSFDGEDDILPDGVPLSAAPSWLPLAAAVGLVSTGAMAIAYAVWPAATPPRPPAQPNIVAATPAVAGGARMPAASARPLQQDEAPAARRETKGATLTGTVQDQDGRPLKHFTICCAEDRGATMRARMLASECQFAETDASGRARFTGLEPGTYDISMRGAISKGEVSIATDDASHTLTLETPSRHVGYVTDPFGRPVAGAEVWITETAGRGDLPALLARTDVGGRYDAAHPLRNALVFARHPDFSPSPCRRLTTSSELQLELEAPTEEIRVAVVTAAGRPVAGAAVTVVPRSSGMTFFAPTTGVTDAEGRCRLPGPGARECAFLAQAEGFAAATELLQSGAKELQITLTAPVRVHGTAMTADGTPLVGREVAATVAGARTNEPTGAMLARRGKVDAEGRFTIEGVARDLVQVRIIATQSNNGGPPLSARVLAGAEVDTRGEGPFEAALVTGEAPSILGELRDPNGAPLADYQIMAVPSVGIASHRLLRRRVTTTDRDGRFSLPAVAPEDEYQLGVYPPNHWWPNPQSGPIALATGRAGQPCALTLDPSIAPAGRLTCQALLPNGKPAQSASYELRHLAYQTPHARPADPSGVATFDGLAAGDYWLAIRVPGIGNRTVALHVDAGQHLDLGAVQLQAPCRLTVQLLGDRVGDASGLRVVARNLLGDKFVSAVSDDRGVATMRPLPPGPSRLLVYGARSSPVVLDLQLEPGEQWIDLDTRSGTPVQLAFPFELCDNPFVINGPLHVRIFDRDGHTVLDDNVGATSARGMFRLALGLPDGEYRVLARSIWNAKAEGSLEVRAGELVSRAFPLR